MLPSFHEINIDAMHFNIDTIYIFPGEKHDIKTNRFLFQ